MVDWTAIETSVIIKAAEIALNTDPKFWKNLTKWFSKEGKEILVLGSSGVGKTQFIHSLSEKTKNTVSNMRTEVSSPIEAKVNKTPFRWIDTVGQPTQKGEREGVFEKNLQNENLVGIINVVSFGYHQIGKPYDNVFDGESFEVKEDFLETNRQTELSYLQEWLPFLHISKVKWIITLVNKIDIWKRDCVKAEQHYTNTESPYQQAFVRTFQNKLFSKPHIVLPYTSALEPFCERHPMFVGESGKNAYQDHFKTEFIKLT